MSNQWFWVLDVYQWILEYGYCALTAMHDRTRKRERKSIESKILICRFRPLALSQWGVQFISGQIRKQETPIMNHIDDNDATNIPLVVYTVYIPPKQ